jgi:hypothetical protein
MRWQSVSIDRAGHGIAINGPFTMAAIVLFLLRFFLVGDARSPPIE